MALTLINENLVLSEQQFAWVSAAREALGYHHYYTGDGITENPYAFNLSSSIQGGAIVITVVLSVPDNNKKFDFSLEHIFEVDGIHYKSSVDSSNKMKVDANTSATGVHGTTLTGNDVAILPGTHVFRVLMERRAYLRFYWDDKEFLKDPIRRFSSLRRLIIHADALTVYEAHFTESNGRRAYVFSGNGLEVPLMPVLYAGSYVSFSGTALDNKRSWVQIRVLLSQDDPNETFFIRKDATLSPAEIKVVVNVYESHYAVWTDEGFQAVYATKIREPRSFSIYEFVLSSALLCVPSS
ncbi:uncharacterized protein [Dermacentor andersoni]|uniref:uncharacterized protein n=1 Tax=Dermacentor andersoni TaxID=34620 RepID=UPI002415BF68|nr:uncharacterized protein LOC126530258 [Dermacentor andersoni]